MRDNLELELFAKPERDTPKLLARVASVGNHTVATFLDDIGRLQNTLSHVEEHATIGISVPISSNVIRAAAAKVVAREESNLNSLEELVRNLERTPRKAFES